MSLSDDDNECRPSTKSAGNAAATDCPDAQSLKQFLDGFLDSLTAARVTDHVETCSRCELRLQDLCVVSPGSEELADPPGWDASRAASLALAVGSAGSLQSNVSIPAPEIPGYDIGPVIGQGGMGTVYQAVERDTGEAVAIKTLSTVALQNSDAVRRFEREIRLTRQCVHPHIVQSVASGEFRGTNYLIMEFVDGVNLSDLVRSRGIIPVGAACELIRQAALGLQHAHGLGLIHRDIKPSNLLLSRDGIVKIADLGLATLSGHAGTTALTVTGQIMGTVDYMAPEQALAGQPIDQRADLYSLGATLFKLLTGHAPFENDSYDSPVRKIAAFVTAASPDIGAYRSDLPAGLVDVTNRLRDFDCEKRFATASSVIESLQPWCEVSELEELARSVVVSALGKNNRDTLAAAGDQTPRHAATLPSSITTPVARRSRKTMAVSIVAIPGVLAGIVVFMMAGGEIATESDEPPRSVETVHIVGDREDQVSEAEWLNRSFRLNGIDYQESPTVYLGIDERGEFQYVNHKEARWRLLPQGDMWLLQHAGSEKMLTARSGTSVGLEEYNGSQTQLWRRRNVEYDRRYWAFQSVEYSTWLWTGGEPRLVEESEVFTNGWVQRAGAIDVRPEFHRLEPELHDIWKADQPTFSDGPRSVDIITSDEWEWTEPRRLGPEINNGIHPTYHPSMTPDGLTLMFSRIDNGYRSFVAVRETLDSPFEVRHQIIPQVGNRAGGELAAFAPLLATIVDATPDGKKISHFEMASWELSLHGEWIRTNIFANANSKAGEDEPAFSADGLTLIFASNRPGGVGGKDLWMAKRRSIDIPFEPPVHLGGVLNTPETENYPALSVDGLTLVYGSTALDETNRLGLWIATRQSTGDSFGSPQAFRPGGDPDMVFIDPSLALNGRLLIFQGRSGNALRELYYSYRVRKHR